MRPILSEFASVNHRAPSGPVVMPNGPASGVGSGNEVMLPVVVMRPIRWLRNSVNHRASSGPVVMIDGPLAAGSTW